MLIGVNENKYPFILVKYNPNLHWYFEVNNTTLPRRMAWPKGA